MVTSRVKKHRVRLNLNPIPLTPPPLVNLDLDLDQRQTPRPLRQTVCPRPQTPACLSPWITLGRTWLLLMSLQTLRVVNYMQILYRMRRNRTHGLIRRGGDVREETTESIPPTMIRRSSTELQHRFQTYHCLRKLFCCQQTRPKSYVAIFVCTCTAGRHTVCCRSLGHLWYYIYAVSMLGRCLNQARLNVCARTIYICLCVLTVIPGEMLPPTGRRM